ncbi:hypothetical protein P7C70_g4685, partial [Phenoliferia sp. Uapishka_3]
MATIPLGRPTIHRFVLSTLALLFLATAVLGTPTPFHPPSQQPDESPRYLPLPKLRQQAKIQDAWRDERFSRAPALLKKHGVDAWIMTMLEYSEDTVFFSMKSATDFSARRRTLYLFHTSTNFPNPMIWIDNTPQLWKELNETLTSLRPRSMQVHPLSPPPPSVSSVAPTDFALFLSISFANSSLKSTVLSTSPLLKSLKKSNRMQDLVRKNMVPGKPGDQVLKETLGDMKEEGIEGLVYSHPIGDWGHSAGTLIGMTNLQKTVPGVGSFPLLKNSWYSVELSASHWIPEWKYESPPTLSLPLPPSTTPSTLTPFFACSRTQNFQQEEDVAWSEETGKWEWVRGRQERFWLVKQKNVKVGLAGLAFQS